MPRGVSRKNENVIPVAQPLYACSVTMTLPEHKPVHTAKLLAHEHKAGKQKPKCMTCTQCGKTKPLRHFRDLRTNHQVAVTAMDARTNQRKRKRMRKRRNCAQENSQRWLKMQEQQVAELRQQLEREHSLKQQAQQRTQAVQEKLERVKSSRQKKCLRVIQAKLVVKQEELEDQTQLLLKAEQEARRVLCANAAEKRQSEPQPQPKQHYYFSSGNHATNQNKNSKLKILL